ncbi:hypothetical protein [Fusobacterium ulcerans]|uniref:hypothetical protein n=1 Tax=Fusobacterium ulcerans TaxID=861 RepID=UPI0030A85DE1
MTTFGDSDKNGISTHILIRTEDNLSYAYSVYAHASNIVLEVNWSNGVCSIFGNTQGREYGVLKIYGIC